MKKYKVIGKVTRTDDNGTRVVARSSIIKESSDPGALKRAWEADMRADRKSVV